MESTIVKAGKTHSKSRINLLAAINDDNSLCLAVKNGALSSFISLLRQGTPMTARVMSLIFDSWTDQGPQFCEAWLCEGGSLNGFYDNSTPLKLALGHDACVRWLLEHRADPNAPPRRGQTVPVDLLTLAAADCSPSTVRLLLEHGARKEETRALHAAATTSAIEIEEGNFQPVPSRVEILRLLLEHGADANEMEADPKALRRPRDSFTGTPLHRAVKNGSVEAVRCLLAYVADVSARGWSGVTAMDVAKMYRRQDMVDVLQDHIDGASDRVCFSQHPSAEGELCNPICIAQPEALQIPRRGAKPEKVFRDYSGSILIRIIFSAPWKLDLVPNSP